MHCTFAQNYPWCRG